MPHFSATLAHLLGGVALSLAFALLTRRRLTSLLSCARAQSAVVAATAALQARQENSAVFAGLALAVLLVGAAALPWLFGRHAAATPDIADAPPPAVALSAAAGAVVLALLAVLPAHVPGLPPVRENLALALAVVLVALLIIATRRAALPQLIGLHALANGAALVAAVAGAALPAAVAVVALFGFAAIGPAVRPTAADRP